MCFTDEIANYEGFFGVMLSSDYVEDLLQILINQPELDSALGDFCVLALRDDEDAPLAPVADVIMDDVIGDIASLDILGHVLGEFDTMGPPPFFFLYFVEICLPFG